MHRPVADEALGELDLSGTDRDAHGFGQLELAILGGPAFRSSASAWDRWSVPLEHGHALMGAARCLRALDRPEEAEALEADGRHLLEALGVPEVTAPRT